jgi:hypothetical protein
VARLCSRSAASQRERQHDPQNLELLFAKGFRSKRQPDYGDQGDAAKGERRAYFDRARRDSLGRPLLHAASRTKPLKPLERTRRMLKRSLAFRQISRVLLPYEIDLKRGLGSIYPVREASGNERY